MQIDGAGENTGAADARRDEQARRWVAGVRRGDARALEGVYRAWFDVLVRAVCEWTRRDEAFAMDAVQDAMVKLIDKAPEVTGEGHLGAWLKRAALSAAIDRIRKESRSARREVQREIGRGVGRGAGEGVVDADGGEVLVEAEMKVGVEQLLAELSVVDQELVRERIGRGRELKAVGEGTGMSVGAVQGRVRRILAGLQSKAKEMFR